MNRRFTRQVAIGAATALLAAGGGVAFAASNGSDTDESRRHLADGPRFGDGFGAPPAPPAPGDAGERPRRVHGVFGFGPGAPLDGAADYLGLADDELRERLHDGRTLAEIARAQGKSVQGLEDALLAAARERLDEAVKRGPLTGEQRDELLRGLASRIGDLVAGRLPAPPRFGGDGPRVHGFGDCGPRDERGGRGERGAGRGERGQRETEPAPPRSERGSTTPGSWDGAASGAVTA